MKLAKDSSLRHWEWAGIILLLLLFMPFFLLSFFSFPSADDYSIAFMARDQGFFAYQKMMYTSWTGRYTANFLEALNPLTYGYESAYRAVSAGLLILLPLGIYLLIRRLSPKGSSRRSSLLITLIASLAYLNLIPGISESLYWATGATEYLLANILELFLIISLLRMYKAVRSSHRLLWFFSTAILTIAIAGLNEISLVLTATILAAILIPIWRNKPKLILPFLSLFIIATGAGLFEIMAPGNYARMDQFGQHFAWAEAIGGAIKSLLKLLGLCFQNPAFLLLSFILFHYFTQNEKTRFYKLYKKPAYLLLFLLIGFAFLIGLYLIPHLSMGINPPLRVHALVLMIFMGIWSLLLYYFSQFIRFTVEKNFKLPPYLLVTLMIIGLILTLLDFYKKPGGAISFRANIPAAFYDLCTKAPAYRLEEETRRDDIRNALTNNSDTLYLQPISNPPEQIFFIDITEDPNHWINRSMSKYYHAPPISLKKESH